MKKREIFKVEGDKINRLRRTCPKCGEGIFLAEHKDRLSCGNCGYTEFKVGGRKTPEKPAAVEEKPVETPEESVESKPVEEPVQKQETTEVPPEDSIKPKNKLEEPKEEEQKPE